MEDALLECQVCYERFDSDSRRPKFLACGHTFCLSCLCASDNKCSTCRTPFKGSAMNLPDNFILLSVTDNSSKKKAFWCLDCQKGADAECEDSHTICSMKKILTEQMGDISERTQEQLRKEEVLVNKLCLKLADTKSAMQGLSSIAEREMTAHGFAKYEVGKVLSRIPEVEDNPKDDSLESLKSHLSNSEERYPILEKKVHILEMLDDCIISVKPSNSEDQWDVNLSMSSDDVSEDHKVLYYLLYRIIGRQNFKLPEAVTLPDTEDAGAAVPRNIAPSPNGTCTVQVVQNSRILGHVAISVLENIAPHKKDLLLTGLNGVKLYPKFAGTLTGSMRTDLFLPSSCIKPSKGSVSIARSPLQPISFFVQKPGNAIPKTGMCVWGKVVANLELLESIVQNWETTKAIVTLSCPRWAC